MFREREKKFVNDDFLLNNTSIWKDKKKIMKIHLCAHSKTKSYLAELTLENGNFNELLGSRKLVRDID